MPEQVTINFDASGYESFERCQQFFSHQTHRLRDAQGRVVKQAVQAMEMDMSPSQWSQKTNESNNTTVTLNDAEVYTEKFGDTEWINWLFWRHVVNKKNKKEELLRMKEEIEKKLSAM